MYTEYMIPDYRATHMHAVYCEKYFIKIKLCHSLKDSNDSIMSFHERIWQWHLVE